MNEGLVKYRSKKDKKLYIRNIELKLAEKEATLSLIKRKINVATESGRIHASDQLRNAEHQADCCVAELGKQLEQLENADDQSWEGLRFRVDTAWDDLSQSIRKLVARFP